LESILSAKDLVFMNLIAYPPLAIPHTKTTFITGESGSGKSTLFRLFNATVAPSAGTIYYQNNNLEDLDTISLRKEVLLMAQNVFLFSGTIRENFTQFFDYRAKKCIHDDEMRMFLQLCCADFPLEANCENLSGGERQRVFLAIHLALAPKVLLLDEPTSALDEGTAVRMLGQVKAYCKQKQITLLIICHDQKLVDQFAENTVILERKVRV